MTKKNICLRWIVLNSSKLQEALNKNVYYFIFVKKITMNLDFFFF